MNPDKRDVILREIAHWRRSRLLPEQYCDFLENLYRDHDESPAAARPMLSLSSFSQGSWKAWLLSFGIISFFFFISFYFSLFAWPLQIGITLLVPAICYVISGFYRERRDLFSLVMAGAGSFILLGLGSWILLLQGWSSGLAFMTLIAGCGLVWLSAGTVLKIGILMYCGFAAFILVYAFMFDYLHPEYSWIWLQVVWLPISIIVFWVVWLVHQRSVMVSRVLFALSVTLWFMPEADYFLLRQQPVQGMELILLLKIVLALGILFGLRKKWVVWISS
ncbi:hypothetical protein [Paenibacillus brevis]|uniref:DUF2157 domain-containing protein n=1 Tax=Paenibacillus brevis TaxID=2841508 RepID=A0ABS6FWG7_9BACL|nr:hypothetical protein [Paenibacillus brevis]MBU5674586.1 hypothetical protein [Paenibacillus brevis]